jgi:hypothetical protein
MQLLQYSGLLVTNLSPDKILLQRTYVQWPGGNSWKGRLLRLEYKRAGEFAPFSALFQIELIALHDLKIETRHTDLCCHENDHTIETETFFKTCLNWCISTTFDYTAPVDV